MIGKGRKKHYDPEQCFLAWVSGGTLEMAQQILYDKGIRSVEGNIPPKVSIQHSANTWIKDSPDEARKVLIAAGLTHLKMEVAWDNFYLRRARTVFASEARFFHWLLDKNLVDKARELKVVPGQYGKDRSI